MTDQSAYVNAYIENIMSMVHDQLNQIIQLKTQIKVTESLLSQKESTIADLTSKVSTSQHTESEVKTLKEKLKVTEDSFHALTNKVSHMDTLMNQIVEMKKIIQEKDRLLAEKDQQIQDLSTPKKTTTHNINRKSNGKSKKKPLEDVVVKEPSVIVQPQDLPMMTESVNDF
jgi:chromosome segregation ATPase